MKQEYLEAHKMAVAVDCIIFGFDTASKSLNLLSVPRDLEPEKGKWSLIGGFIQPNESLDQAAIRVLYNHTGLNEVYMEQLQAFGDINRDPVERTISIAYFALVNVSNYDASLLKKYGAVWFPVNDRPKLIFDHDDMVELAQKRLQSKPYHEPLGNELLPEKFTMPQLQTLYEAIFETTLDKRNFSRRMLETGLLSRLDEKQKGFSKKGAWFYTFKKVKHEV